MQRKMFLPCWNKVCLFFSVASVLFNSAIRVNRKNNASQRTSRTTRTRSSAYVESHFTQNSQTKNSSSIPIPDQVANMLVESGKGHKAEKARTAFFDGLFHSVAIVAVVRTSKDEPAVLFKQKMKDGSKLEIPRGTVESVDGSDVESAVSWAARREVVEELGLEGKLGVTAGDMPGPTVMKSLMYNPTLGSSPSLKKLWKQKAWWPTRIELSKTLEELELPWDDVTDSGPSGKKVRIVGLLCSEIPSSLAGGPEIGDDSEESEIVASAVKAACF
mmetsp:Transcript_8791/g.14312  ORF Transcript_8791/g.14312 Transcript_8791/m.14312 type:complete len:274 (+) Transcript_8791:64-885(+)